jgi:hypothetical protein
MGKKCATTEGYEKEMTIGRNNERNVGGRKKEEWRQRYTKMIKEK